MVTSQTRWNEQMEGQTAGCRKEHSEDTGGAAVTLRDEGEESKGIRDLVQAWWEWRGRRYGALDGLQAVSVDRGGVQLEFMQARSAESGRCICIECNAFA